MWDSILTRLTYPTLVQKFLTEYDYKHSNVSIRSFTSNSTFSL